MPAYADITYADEGLSETEIRASYPNAKIIHTTESEYSEVAETLRSQGYTVQNNTPSAQQNTSNNSSDFSDCKKSTETSSDDSVRIGVEITDDILHSAGNSNEKQAVVVFVIIGTVVVIVWSIYVFKYMFDLASGFKPCYPWYELTFTSSALTSPTIKQLDLNALRFMTGFSDENTDFGIAVEFGRANINLTDNDSTDFGGRYWMLGPVLRWHLNKQINPHTFQMSFMGGTTEHNAVNLLARASIGLQLSLSNSFHLGFSWGVMNIELNNDQGIISAHDDYEYFFGVNSGFSF